MESQYSFIYISFVTKYTKHSLLIFTFSFMTIFIHCRIHGRKILMYFFLKRLKITISIFL
jgi:hypothetical protein